MKRKFQNPQILPEIAIFICQGITESHDSIADLEL